MTRGREAQRHSPPSFFGRTLAALDVARRSDVQVILLRRHGESAPRLPKAADPIGAGDRLVVAETVESVEKPHTLR